MLGVDLEKVLASVDIRINGDRPWDIRVNNPRFYRRLALKGSLGAGESYVEGDWDCDALDEAFFRLARGRVDRQLGTSFPHVVEWVRRHLINPQSSSRAFRVGQVHYDRDVELFRKMLDPHMTYSCGYWKGVDTLLMAQESKFELVAQKMGLKRGMRVLDVGSGFGAFAIWAADHYDVEVTGVTVSKSQLKESLKRAEGKMVYFSLMDWRELEGTWDRIVSIGQFEHVGLKNYRHYMEKMRSLLAPDGLFLLHTIGNDVSTLYPDPWIEKYVFPNGLIPSIKQIAEAVEGQLIVEDLHNFGADYDKTLMAWFVNFDAATLDKKSPFYRLWSYYLLSCAGTFRARRLQLWQWVLSPEGIMGGYCR